MNRNTPRPLRRGGLGLKARRAAIAAGTMILIALSTMQNAGAAATVEVQVKDFAFLPAEITVAPGTTIVWINKDDTPHDIVDRARLFSLKPMDAGEKSSFTFDKEGDYDYFCALHPQMTGKVHVKRQ